MKNKLILRQLENFSNSAKGGFTLLEMVISIGIFSVIIIAAIGIILEVSNAQIKVNNIQVILDNARFSLELITKEMRTGNLYSLSSVCGSSGSEISFNTSIGETRVYFLQNSGGKGVIMRAAQSINSSDCDGISGKVQPFTSDDVNVENFKITAQGTGTGASDGQPWVVISLQVKSTSPKYQLDSSMNLQTTVVQRFRDF